MRALAQRQSRRRPINDIQVWPSLATAGTWTQRETGRINALLAVILRAITAMTGFHFACLNDPRLAAHALSPSPAWLWSIDGQRLLWANPIGAAIFENESPAAAA